MIAKLAGIIDQVGAEEVVIDVGGVGYLAFCSARTIGRLPPMGSTAQLLIETHVRVQGVGARLALAILSALAPEQLTLAIAAQDKVALTRAEGVGAKLAARIVNELHDKIATATSAAISTAAIVPVTETDSRATADAVSALVNLGYGRAEAFGAIAAAARLLGGEAEPGALIRAGLHELAR